MLKMAGIFGLFDYSKPGKGISKDEPVKPRFLLFWELFFRKFWKLVQLNLLYVAFCLPIVTIGPATAGFTYVLRNLTNEQPVFLFSDFWDGFKNNLIQSFLYSMLVVAASILFSISLGFYRANVGAASWMYVPLIICMMLALLFVFMSFYILLMIVTIDLPLRMILKNSVILSIVCLKTNFLTLLFVGIIILAVYSFPVASALLVIFIIPALIGFIVCFNSYQGIKKYIIDPFLEANGSSGAASGDETVFEDEDGKGKR